MHECISDYDLEKTETGLDNSVGSISTQELHYDLEKRGGHLPPAETEPLDIEQVPVQNDPRKWSARRKNVTLALIFSASVIGGIVLSILNPAIQETEAQLPATPSQFRLSISLFILILGLMPLFWNAISEVKGRKVVYVSSLSLFILATIGVALSRSIELVIGFRCIQAAGASAAITIGAATLADIYDPAVRGKKIGIYYIAPLLGPAAGFIFGGSLTSAFNWRAIFWFLVILSSLSLISFVLFFEDTFRRERSLTYQNVIKQRRKAADSLEVNLDLSLADVNPLNPIGQILRRKNNIIILVTSGLQFAFTNLISYTSARTLSTFYAYGPVKIGLVILSYGIGGIIGSMTGGCMSDYELTKTPDGGKSYPEMRLRGTFLNACLIVPCILAFGWTCAKQVHISAICVFLFLCGFFSSSSYSTTLAYVVDANNGRSSSAVAVNTAFRGVFTFVAIEVAQDIGDGWLYTIWAGLMLLSGSIAILVWWKGAQWREAGEVREAEFAKRFDLAPTTTS